MPRRALALATVVVAALVAPAARADDKMTCVRAYEEAQTLRKAGKLRASREKLEICKSDKCPEALRNDCRPWSKEVDDALASVVLAVRTKDGRDLTDVRVTLDGEPFAERIDGWALAIDPGPHTLRFEAAGFEPLEMPVVAHEGEKRRTVAAVLTSITKAPPPAAPSAPAPAPDTSRSRPVPAAAYALGGVGVVGVGAFGYFALNGMSKKSDLDRCKPLCAQADVDDARRTFLIGDIALGVGGVSLAAAAYLFFTRSPAEPSAPGVLVEVAPSSHGASAVVRGSF